LEKTMGDTQQPQPAGTSTSAAEAAAALAEIQRRQGHVIEAVLVPGWYWWTMAAGVVAIGAARDTGDFLAQAIAIPLAVLFMAGLTGVMIPALRRRVQVHSARQPDGRGAAAIIGLILLVDGAILGTAAGLSAAGVSYPATIGTAAGAAVLVIGGPLVNRYLRGLMLSQARQQADDAPQAGGTA
jgi:hypothetical protein